MSDRMDSDLPIPISSARTPPPVSEGKNGDLAFVIAWQKLQECLENAMHIAKRFKALVLTRYGHLIRFVSIEKIRAILDRSLSAS